MILNKEVIILFFVLLHFQCSSCSYSNVLPCLKSNGLITITPNDELYRESSQQYFTTGTIYKPKGFVIVQSACDVKKAIRCAKKTKTHVTIKSGGHSYESYSRGSNNSWIIDLSQMKNIKINHRNSTITVESGVTVEYITEYLIKQNYVIAAGTCNDIGLSGLTLGGGFGILSAKLGVTTDQLESVEMVTVDGKIRHVSKNHYPDLFWAVRGGGGNFGVVTKLNLKIYTAPRCVLAIVKTYNRSFAGELFYLWQNYLFTTKDPGSMPGAILLNGENGDATLDFTIVTETKSQCDSVVEEITEIFPGITEKNIVNLGNYFAAQQRVAEPFVVPLNQLPVCHISTNFLGKRRLSISEAKKATDLFFGSNKIFSMLIHNLGGKINDVKRTETAFVHRDSKYFVELYSENDCSDEAKWELKQLFEKYSFMDSGESYQNVFSKLQVNYLHRYYGENLARLVHIKKKYDPENFFCFPQSIPPSLSPFSPKCPFSN